MVEDKDQTGEVIGEHEEIRQYWLDSEGKRHKSADSQRYKALGNSIATGENSFWEWMLKRISAQYDYRPTLGSLFDGIGGFPLIWAQINGVHNCRWASEIEEFPIAVTKRHFGDEDAGIEGDFWKFMR